MVWRLTDCTSPHGAGSRFQALIISLVLITMKMIFPWFLFFKNDSIEATGAFMTAMGMDEGPLPINPQCDIYPDNADVFHGMFGAMFIFLIFLKTLPNILRDVYWLATWYYTRDIDFDETKPGVDSHGEWLMVSCDQALLFQISLLFDLVSSAIFALESAKVMVCAPYAQMAGGFMAIGVLVEIDANVLEYFKILSVSDDEAKVAKRTIFDVCKDREDALTVQKNAYDCVLFVYHSGFILATFGCFAWAYFDMNYGILS